MHTWWWCIIIRSRWCTLISGDRIITHLQNDTGSFFGFVYRSLIIVDTVLVEVVGNTRTNANQSKDTDDNAYKKWAG